jgi:hypothetical protein
VHWHENGSRKEKRTRGPNKQFLAGEQPYHVTKFGSALASEQFLFGLAPGAGDLTIDNWVWSKCS